MASNLQYTPEKVRVLIAEGQFKLPDRAPEPPLNLKGRRRGDFERRMKLAWIYFKHSDLSATQIGNRPDVVKIFSREVSRALVNFHVGAAIVWLMEHGQFVDKSLGRVSRKGQ